MLPECIHATSMHFSDASTVCARPSRRFHARGTGSGRFLVQHQRPEPVDLLVYWFMYHLHPPAVRIALALKEVSQIHDPVSYTHLTLPTILRV